MFATLGGGGCSVELAKLDLGDIIVGGDRGGRAFLSSVNGAAVVSCSQ